MIIARERRVSARADSGFTLVELAVVLFVVGLIVAAFLGPLTTQIESRARARTDAKLVEIIDALYGFAVLRRRLPCADLDGDGLEEAGVPCAPAATMGALPYRTLGLEPGDAWRRRFTYRVDPAFSVPKVETEECRDDDSTVPPNTVDDFDLCELGNLVVRTRGDDPTTPTTEGKADLILVGTAAAVVISHGANGFGALPLDGSAALPAPPPAQADERENLDDDLVFVSRVYSRGEAACSDDADDTTVLCEYDDMLRWVSPALLVDRMVRAGRLP